MQGWDGWLHANPLKLGGTRIAGTQCAEVGMAMLFNPTDITLNTTARVDLYYTGITQSAAVAMSLGGGPFGAAEIMALDRGYGVTLTVNMPPRSATAVAFGDCDA